MAIERVRIEVISIQSRIEVWHLDGFKVAKVFGLAAASHRSSDRELFLNLGYSVSFAMAGAESFETFCFVRSAVGFLIRDDATTM